MEKFSKKVKKDTKKEKEEKDNVLYDAKSMKIVTHDDWNFIEENDSVCILPILLEADKILLRYEVIPPFNYRDKKDYHLTCISGTVEEGESITETIKRELIEEAGVELKNNVKIEVFDNLYKSKSGSSKFHLCILPISAYNYNNVKAEGDGSRTEELSKTVEVDISNIDNLFPSDVVTKLLLEETKKYLRI